MSRVYVPVRVSETEMREAIIAQVEKDTQGFRKFPNYEAIKALRIRQAWDRVSKSGKYPENCVRY